MTIIESAARAIWEAAGRPPKDRDPTASDDAAASPADWESFLPHAQAVLRAIREPTAAMSEAGADIVRNVHVEESEEAFASDAANTWRFMIDAALTNK